MRDVPDGRTGARRTRCRAGSHRVHTGRSGLPRHASGAGRPRAGDQLAPRDRDGADGAARRRRCRGRAHRRLATARVGTHHRRHRSRRRSPGVPPRLRIDERRPRSRRRAARAVRSVGARVAAHRRGRRRGRHRDDVRPRLERRAAGRAADRGAGHADADGHHSCAVRGRRGRAAGPRGDDRREGGDRRGDGRLQAGVPPVGADRGRGGVHERVQHPRPARHHDAGRTGDRVQRAGHPRHRDELPRQRVGTGQPRQLHDRARACNS